MVEDSLVFLPDFHTRIHTIQTVIIGHQVKCPVKVPAYDTPLPFFWVKEPFLESSVSSLKSLRIGRFKHLVIRICYRDIKVSPTNGTILLISNENPWYSRWIYPLKYHNYPS